MSRLPVIAIFDIGKTNKKFFLLNTHYKIVLEKSYSFPEIADDDGDACEDIESVTKWVKEILTDALKNKTYDIKAVNVSAYGASFVYIDKQGKIIAPLYNYLKEYPIALKKNIYKKYGGKNKLSCETASPDLGSLNSGLQLYRLKILKPVLFQKVKYALHLPQYISFLLSRKAVSDITSIGCHTLLWNFENNTYHKWVKDEGIEKKLAPLRSSVITWDISFKNKTLKAGSGLHDSSAALIPYLETFRDPFVLLSTGTWCISLNPFNKTTLSANELKKDCLCYLDYKGHPVKASRLFAGYEHEQQTKRLGIHFKKTMDFYKKVSYDKTIIEHLMQSGFLEKKFTSKIDITENVFAKRDPGKFSTYEEAYHCLLYDIMQKQFASTSLVLHNAGVKKIFADGGFSNNKIFMHLLAIAFPHLEVYASSVPQATAIGAALAIHNAWNANPVPSDLIELTYYKNSFSS